MVQISIFILCYYNLFSLSQKQLLIEISVNRKVPDTIVVLTTIHRKSIKMINSHNVSEVLSDLIFNQFGFNVSSSITPEERNVADNLYDYLISILESNSYFFESETTLDHGEDFCDMNFEDSESSMTIYEQNNDPADINYQPVDEHDLKKFSL